MLTRTLHISFGTGISSLDLSGRPCGIASWGFSIFLLRGRLSERSKDRFTEQTVALSDFVTAETKFNLYERGFVEGASEPASGINKLYTHAMQIGSPPQMIAPDGDIKEKAKNLVATH